MFNYNGDVSQFAGQHVTHVVCQDYDQAKVSSVSCCILCDSCFFAKEDVSFSFLHTVKTRIKETVD